jgi:hypothetical protein
MKKPSSSQPNANPTPTALSIERVQGIGIDANGNTAQWEQLYLKIFQGFVSSGLAARLGGNAALVLITLGLHAGVLGDPQRANAEDEFKLLRELGIVTAQDRGKLFTFIGQDTLAEKLKSSCARASSRNARQIASAYPLASSATTFSSFARRAISGDSRQTNPLHRRKRAQLPTRGKISPW